MAIVSDPGRPHYLRAHLPDFKDPSLERVLQLHPTAKRNHHLLFIQRGVTKTKAHEHHAAEHEHEAHYRDPRIADDSGRDVFWNRAFACEHWAWLKRRPSARKLGDSMLLADVQRIYGEGRGKYGSPRIHGALTKAGKPCGKKRIERLMRDNGIKAKLGRKHKPVTIDSQHAGGTERTQSTVPARAAERGMGHGHNMSGSQTVIHTAPATVCSH